MALLPKYHKWHCQWDHNCETHGLYPVYSLTAFCLAIIYVEYTGKTRKFHGRWFVFDSSRYGAETIAKGECGFLEEGKTAIYRTISHHHENLGIKVIID